MICAHRFQEEVCRQCGIYQFSIGTAFKHKKLISHPFRSSGQDHSIVEFDPGYLEARDSTFEFVHDIHKKLFISERSLHLAFYFLDQHHGLIKKREARLVGLICLFLAAKFIENDCSTPGLKKLHQISELDCDIATFREVERELLNLIGWKFKVDTLFDQVQNLLSQGAVFSTDYQIINHQQVHLENRMISSVCNQMANEHQRLTYQVVREVSFSTVSTRSLAMALVLYLRKVCQLHPLFPAQLQTLEPESEQLIEIYGRLSHFFENRGSKYCIKTCRSLPPAQRPPLRQIVNQPTPFQQESSKKAHRDPCVVPKLINRKHVEVDPFRKNKPFA